MNDPSQQSRPFVLATGVSRSFREGEVTHDVLRSLDLQVMRGELVALRGRSGSGKSTMLNVLSGIDTPDAGDIFIDNSNITRMSEKDRTVFRRQNIGFVYQAFNLVPTLSVANNVRLVLELNRVPEPECGARIDYLLEAVGIRDRANAFPDILSGGEQQRVAIARALAHQPALIVADEPTGNLDEQTAESVLDLLGSMAQKNNSTMIVATHSTRVADICDRVLELHDGRLDD